jgi:hypothetical protein
MKRSVTKRPGPRFYYLNGELEIKTTSNEQETIKEMDRRPNGRLFEEAGIEVMPRGAQSNVHGSRLVAPSAPASPHPLMRAAVP